jgi:selenocysteine lyase/cysteine desulfurase
MSPLLKSVEKAGLRGLRAKRNPTEVSPVDFFTESELLRKEYAKLIHVTDPKRIVIIPSVSYGMATVAKNLKLSMGDEIIVASEQFPSNYYAWEKICSEAGAQVKIISPPQELISRGKTWNERILDSINAKTKVVALGHVHWADGTLFDLGAIRIRTREVGALLIVDGTQSVGALPFDVQKIQPDALICGGYKWLMGPYSIGLAYYGEYFNEGKPLEENWINRKNSEDFSNLINYQSAYQEGALRYEVGEHSNFILVPMLLKAVEQINKWHVENIQEYCASITNSGISTLKQKGFWVEDENYRGSHLIGIRIPKEKNIQSIKEQLLKKNIYVSYRGDAIRLAPNVYNDAADINKLIKVLIS